MISSILFFLVALLFLKSSHGTKWTHGWERALDAQFIDFGYQLLTAEQASFVASHYSIVSIEKCTGKPHTEQGIWTTAQQLKQLNPLIKVLFYSHTDQDNLDCYDASKEFLSHPEWWLRNDTGATIFNPSSPTIPVMDFSVVAARAWWVNTPLNGTNASLSKIIDGVFADGAGFIRCPGINAARCATLLEAKRELVREMQALLKGTNDGLVFQNPPKDFDQLKTLGDAGGIMGEHFAAFEQVTKVGLSFSYDATKIAAYIDAVARASAANKTVVVATWPGPLSTPFTSNGFPSWIDGTQPTTAGGWKEPMAEYHAFALAGYLTMAEDNVWMQYQTWYNGFSQGAIFCGAALTCSAPYEWYPDLYQPLGRPLGPAVRIGNKWTRYFENAVSVFDLDHPRRNGTNVTFFTPSLSASITMSMSASATPSPTQSSVERTSVASATSSSSISSTPSALPSVRNGTGDDAANNNNNTLTKSNIALAVTLPLLALFFGLLATAFLMRRQYFAWHVKKAVNNGSHFNGEMRPRSWRKLNTINAPPPPESSINNLDGVIVSENPINVVA